VRSLRSLQPTQARQLDNRIAAERIFAFRMLHLLLGTYTEQRSCHVSHTAKHVYLIAVPCRRLGSASGGAPNVLSVGAGVLGSSPLSDSSLRLFWVSDSTALAEPLR
jgi:hypothetical protein